MTASPALLRPGLFSDMYWFEVALDLAITAERLLAVGNRLFMADNADEVAAGTELLLTCVDYRKRADQAWRELRAQAQADARAAAPSHQLTEATA